MSMAISPLAIPLTLNPVGIVTIVVASSEVTDMPSSIAVVVMIAIVALIDSATESVYVEQLYAYKYWGKAKTGSVETTPNLFLEAILRAARRGCEVRIILDSTWYNVERDNPSV